MGKTELEQALDEVPASPEPPLENAARRCPPCRSVGRIVSLRCVSALLFGVAVLLSGVFWLPPFFRRGFGSGMTDLDKQYGADVVASFKLQKPVALLNANVAKLQYDIFAEIGVPNTTVAVINMEPLGINSTNIVFGMWPYPKNSNISTGLSILKSSFVSLVLRQSDLHLTTSLFGSSYFFQILKFPGGITVVPPQNAFLLQKEHMIFNFSLNFPIYQVEDKIDELKDQMKLGLHLTSYEILFVRLTNINGSTVAPPIVIETSIVFAVGNNLPSVPRLKQLAQNIRNSSAGNLGLNHTIFGRVKQIRLSSFLQHSLNSGAASPLPHSPAPQPSVDRHDHHHSHNRHHGHHSDVHVTPTPPPAPAPKPLYTQVAPPPSGCRFRFPRTPKREHQIVPVMAPASPRPHHSSASPSIEVAPAPPPYLPPKSQKSSVIFASSRPPSEAARDIKPQNIAPSIPPLPSSSFVSSGRRITHLIFASVLYLLWL
ncbi:uncharacterized protein LOC110102923 [Dendrobium catenatum]|uniref:Hydroxymethylglutaryl-CoA reductase (NADPH)-like protein n=2 Tax=Dendrobium TaxID=37818 RepID=A0A7T0BR93_DENNO|nr:uncharacterized protein LOC110102923 [Dendrobium catenatum]PKU64884.1 hypothetical protein MA16_Dca022333 [Dendrobium catenatum]QPJ58196.1 hydroxymethylglutaryl-CoA reductase (NADPH)-like protein [Dendrobium nobile]